MTLRAVSAHRHGRQAVLPAAGTRFLLYPQAPVLSGIHGPETVWVSPPAGTIGPGPSDARMYVVDPIDKTPYEGEELPPYRGAAHAPALPGPTGHFDHIDLRRREFLAAHCYGTLRFVLDVWEKYFGAALPWHFAAHFDRLEIVPLVRWNNAQCGYGYIEFGTHARGLPGALPLCLNFDVIAHEVGHALIYSLLGMPASPRVPSPYVAFHESAADCVAMIAALHFDSVVDRLLTNSRGNIYLPNELNRIGELSNTEQIRNASQSLTIDDVPSTDTPLEELTHVQRHSMSLPLTGAVFDTLVEVFQEILVRERLIGQELDEASRQLTDANAVAIQRAFDLAYLGREAQFKAALLDARDYTARCLARAWQELDGDVTFDRAAAAMLRADRALTGGAGREILVDCLVWRHIEPF
jgi:hypothetical protein